MTENRTIRLQARPAGMVGPEHFAFAYEPLPVAGDGELLVKTAYISLDPAMRGWLNEGRSYIPPVEIGAVMRAGTVGEVVESRADGFNIGDWVVGNWGVQDYGVVPAKDATRIDIGVAPPERWLGVLGMPGMTAYFGLLDVGALKDGETVVVSAAAGAVGGLVGQIAKTRDCRVVGIAGGPDKCDYVVRELGFDACVDYKAGSVLKDLAATCPKGIDIYFDNVGGPILEAAMTLLRRGARIVICGAISGYNDFSKIQGPRNYLNLLVQRARMEGFVVFDYQDRYGEAVRDIAGWLASGRVKAKEDVQEGLERFPHVLQMLFRGENFGKLVLKP
jgi:hypothetical protein